MKPEESEKILVEELFQSSVKKKAIDSIEIEDIEKLTGDASTRKYYRVVTKKQNYVVCLDRPSRNKENDFIKTQSLLYSNNVPVPQVYDFNLLKGYILEEDLGDMTFLKRLASIEGEDEELSLYKVAIDNIIEFHKVKWPKDLIEERSFNKEKLSFEVGFSNKYFIEKYLKGTKEKSELINNLFEPLVEDLTKGEMVVCHRDYHSRNIMLVDKKQIIIDFQDIHLGLRQYDLCSLLEDSYYKITDSNKKELIKYYLKKSGIKSSEEDFLSKYNLMCIQRIYKAIGSFAYIYDIRKDLRYLKYIGYSFEKLRNILLENEDLANLRKELSLIYYEH